MNNSQYQNNEEGLQKEDLRIQKTRRSLRKAIFELIEIKSIEKVNVTEICSRALVNRMTFYKYYEDKYMLLDDAMHMIADDMIASMPFNGKPSSLSEASECCTKLLEIVLKTIHDNRATLLAFKRNDNNKLLEIITNVAEQSINELFEQLDKIKKLKYPIPLLSSFVFGGFASTVRYWLDYPNSLSQDDINKVLYELRKLIVESELIFE